MEKVCIYKNLTYFLKLHFDVFFHAEQTGCTVGVFEKGLQQGVCDETTSR